MPGVCVFVFGGLVRRFMSMHDSIGSDLIYLSIQYHFLIGLYLCSSSFYIYVKQITRFRYVSNVGKVYVYGWRKSAPRRY